MSNPARRIQPRPGESMEETAARIVDADNDQAGHVSRRDGWLYVVAVTRQQPHELDPPQTAEVMAKHPAKGLADFFLVHLPGHLSTPCRVMRQPPPPNPAHMPTREDREAEACWRRRHRVPHRGRPWHDW